ncbi:PilN domain-containing protein [Rhodopirellula bahusiensis]|uniref:Fimbrial assembly protein n=1 Tax=Rhodopirellula bahusiensis TaxID=2014065 RepID=A0A2G1W637_9BACT|nr:hypothetical protein [Rhodopirellula bahusiensis]PHQ34492.1 hypothetical protein CEE69_15960 [Rhodopirellula bahusiensis]
MNTATQHTVVLVSDSFIARVDISAGPVGDVVWSKRTERPEDFSLGESIELAYDDGPRTKGRVWILTDEVWSGEVTLASKIAKAIPTGQLEQTLALQAEEHSGSSPFNSRLGHVAMRRSGADSTWWVTQAEQDQLDEVTAAIPAWAGKLTGLASMNMAPDEITDFFEGDNTESYGDLAKEWLAKHLSNDGTIPIIEPDQRATHSSNAFRNSLIVTTIVIATTAALHIHGERRLADAETVLSRIVNYEKQLRKDVDRSEAKAIQDLDAQEENQANLTAEIENQNRLRQQIGERLASSKRPSQVLSTLEATAGMGHWMQGIELKDRRITLSGLAMDCLTVSNLLERLELEFGSLLSRVQPSEMSATPFGDLVQFELRLTFSENGLLPNEQPLSVHGSVAANVR